MSLKTEIRWSCLCENWKKKLKNCSKIIAWELSPREKDGRTEKYWMNFGRWKNLTLRLFNSKFEKSEKCKGFSNRFSLSAWIVYKVVRTDFEVGSDSWWPKFTVNKLKTRVWGEGGSITPTHHPCPEGSRYIDILYIYTIIHHFWPFSAGNQSHPLRGRGKTNQSLQEKTSHLPLRRGLLQQISRSSERYSMLGRIERSSGGSYILQEV